MNWNPHLHALVTSGTFRSDGSFEPILLMQENVLRELFEAEVFKLLVKKELISRELIGKMRTWRHSGFHVYAGPALTDIQDAVRVGLYIVRPSASATVLCCFPERNGSPRRAVSLSSSTVGRNFRCFA